jgi:hypothetical protein
MSPHMGATRKRIQEKLNTWRSSAHARGTAYAGYLREIQDDIVIMSPKVYESGIITRLDLRLVDLYGDCIIEDDAISTSTEHEPVS